MAYSTALLRRLALARSSSIRTRGFHHNPATVLPSSVSTASPDFVEKASAMDALVSDLEKHLATARLGGGHKALEKMRARGKKVPRDRFVLIIPIWARKVIVQVSFGIEGSRYSWIRILRSWNSHRWLLMKYIRARLLPEPV